MKQIISHWRLAYRTTKKAISVTISMLMSSFKAYRYILLNESRLRAERKKINKALLEEFDKI